ATSAAADVQPIPAKALSGCPPRSTMRLCLAGKSHEYLEAGSRSGPHQWLERQYHDGDAGHPHHRDRRRLAAGQHAGGPSHPPALWTAARRCLGSAGRNAGQYRGDAHARRGQGVGGRTGYQREPRPRRARGHRYRHRADAAPGPNHPGMGDPHRGRKRRTGMHFPHHHGGGARARHGPALNGTPYASLTPDLVLDAVSACGLWPDGRLLALNSYENRVWQVGLEDSAPVIAKFYRPGRWSDAAIIEEHAFARELADAELPVVAPLAFGGRSLLQHRGFRYALSPRQGGRAPELETNDALQWLGRLIARMHVVGARTAFVHRGRLDRATMVEQPAQAVLDSPLLPASLRTHYRAAATHLDNAIAARLEAVGPVQQLRLH